MLLRAKNTLWESIPTLYAFLFLTLMLLANLWQSWIWKGGFSRLELLAYLITVFLVLSVSGRKIYPTLPNGIRRKIGMINARLGFVSHLSGLLAIAYFLDRLASPARASILLGNLRTKLTEIIGRMSGITEGAAGMESLITFVFATFELLILGYIAYSAVQLFSKRDDERWLDLLRTPALILGSVLATNFVVGLL